MDFHLSQISLTVSSSALACIARGAPLTQTLTCIANDIEEQHPDSVVAILILDEDNCMRLGAAPTLHPDYRHAINGMTVGGIVQGKPEDIETNPASSDFCRLALQHGLHVCSLTPLRCGTDYIHGILVTYTRAAETPSENYWQALAGMAALASIAIEQHAAAIRIKKAEDALLQNETIMALAIEGSNTGIWDRNIQTNQINYSNGWKAILGYAATEVGNRIEESYTRVHPDDLASVKAAMQAHFDHSMYCLHHD